MRYGNFRLGVVWLGRFGVEWIVPFRIGTVWLKLVR